MRFLILTILLLTYCHFSYGASLQDVKIDITGSARVRAEGSDNRDFSSTYDKNDFTGNRFRLGFNVSTNDNTSFFLELQHSNTWGDSSGKTLDESSSIHQAFILHSINEFLQFKVGRQELLYGDQLLVGPVGWSNVGRSFDAYKAKWTHSYGWSDIFVADVTKGSGATATNNHFFSGLYNHMSLEMIEDLDIYVFHTKDPAGVSKNKVVHYGSRVKSQQTATDYRVELTGQSEVTGHQADAEFGYRPGDSKKSRIALEIFTSSKDYVQLFPTGHKFLGIGDFFSRRNLSGLRLGLNGPLHNNVQGNLDYHVFRRTDDSSPIYNFSGTAVGATGDSMDVGSEIDLSFDINLHEKLKLSVGGAYLFVGEYLKDNNLENDGQFYFVQIFTNI